MSSERSAAARPVVEDLQRLFGKRLQAVVAYGWRRNSRVPTLALVSELTMDDLNACAAHVHRWHRAGAATPLLLTRTHFERSLDAFPIEYGEILESHEVLAGSDPFSGLAIAREDLRRACEVQVKSHLLHLREDYVESGGHRAEVEALVYESAPGFAALVRQLARLDDVRFSSRHDLVDFAHRRMRLDPRVVGDLLELADNNDGPAPIDPIKLFPDYLVAMERLSEFIDQWRSL
jgi:hypothetical protein